MFTGYDNVLRALDGDKTPFDSILEDCFCRIDDVARRLRCRMELIARMTGVGKEDNLPCDHRLAWSQVNGRNVDLSIPPGYWSWDRWFGAHMREGGAILLKGDAAYGRYWLSEGERDERG